MVVVWLFLAVPGVYLQFVTVVFPDHTQLLFLGLVSILYNNMSSLVMSNSDTHD